MTAAEGLSHGQAEHSVGFTLGAIALAVAMVCLSAAYGFSALFHHDQVAALPVDGGPRVETKLVGTALDIPASWFRGGPPQGQGFASSIELQLNLPLGRGGTLQPIGITLLPLSQVRTSVRLLDGVYLHEFMPNELSGPPGLVGKPLYPREGFENETVWYDALSPNPFVAKCSEAPVEGGAAQCLRTVALGDGLAAVYSFGSDVLLNWKAFDRQLAPWLKDIGALRQ